MRGGCSVNPSPMLIPHISMILPRTFLHQACARGIAKRQAKLTGK